MKKLSLVVLFGLAVSTLNAQPDSITRIKIEIGFSAPELLHLGIGVNLANWSQVGISAGIGPSWGEVWPTLNIEHRLYFGEISERTKRRKFFCRQGGTYFPAGNEGAVTLTLGIDLRSKRVNSGWTIDAGAFILFRNRMDYENQLYPALRFQYYGFFKKSRKNNS